MDDNQLSAKDSLRLIQSVIDNRKQKYEENGLTILVWGILVFAAGVTQYAMIVTGKGEKSYYAWVFTMIPAFVITMIVKSFESTKKAREKRPADIMGLVWLMAGLMAMLTGFIFGNKFGIGFTAMMFAPFCVAALATGLHLNEKVFSFMSVLAAITCYVSLVLPMKMQPLIAAFIALFLMIIPGIKLFRDHKNRNRV